MSQNAAIRYTSVLSTRVVNEFTAGMSRFGALFTQGEANPDFPNTPAFSRAAGTSFTNVDAPFRNVPRTFREVTTPQFLDDLTITHGSHIIKTGVNIRLYRHNDQRGQPGGATVTPTLSFLPASARRDYLEPAGPGGSQPRRHQCYRLYASAGDHQRHHGPAFAIDPDLPRRPATRHVPAVPRWR